MLMPTSSEFVALCRAQVTLLTQGLGASLSVVYLTQQLVEGAETQLVPIVAYPETAVDWGEQRRSVLPFAEASPADSIPRLLADSQPLRVGGMQPLPVDEPPMRSFASHPEAATTPDTHAIVPQRQIVLPLIHEDAVLGLLVVGRDDRGWSEWEQHQIEQIADTLTLSCVLDQRYQWLEHEQQQQQMLQAQQHDVTDNLLHQFRNSLTALQTFGKLILRRLLPEDPNREIATSIVRETGRLQELTQQLESATGLTREREEPLFLPPAAGPWSLQATADTPAADAHPPQIAPLLPGAGLSTAISLPLEPCSVTAVIAPLLASAQTIAQDRNLLLHALLPDKTLAVWANAQALREVLNNLLENALKYTPSGGHILVQASQSNSTESQLWVDISVSDTGPGIPPQDLPHIFERRYRGVQAETSIPGSGLGLAIAKVLVEQMHGEIQVISPARTPELLDLPPSEVESLGAGTTLTLRLPAVTEYSQKPA